MVICICKDSSSSSSQTNNRGTLIWAANDVPEEANEQDDDALEYISDQDDDIPEYTSGEDDDIPEYTSDPDNRDRDVSYEEECINLKLGLSF